MSVNGWGGAVDLTVEIDFGQVVVDSGTPPSPVGTGLWDGGSWDDGASTWAGRDPVWTDVTDDVRGITTSHSFSRQTNHYNTSTASFTLDNSRGDYSVTNTGGPHYGRIGVLRRARVRVTYYDWVVPPVFDTVNFDLFNGYIQSWHQTYPEMSANSIVEVSLVGLESQIASFVGFPETAQGAGETTGQRVRRILDNSGWTGPVDIDEGETTMQATTLEGSAANLLQQAADAEGGFVYWRPDGTACFDGFNAQAEKGRIDNWTLFTDDPPAGYPDGIRYQDIVLSYDGDLVANVINYQNAGGTVQQVTSPNSRSLYGDRVVTMTDLQGQSDAHVARIANRDLIVRQNPEFRVESISFSPMAADNNYDYTPYGGLNVRGGLVWQALAYGRLNLRQGAQIVLTPKHESNPVTRFCFVESITHNIPDRRTWNINLGFSSASAYVDASTSLFDGWTISPQAAAFFDNPLSRWGW